MDLKCAVRAPDSSTGEIADNSARAASAAQATNHSAEQTEHAARELARTSQQLRQLVERFQL